MKNTLETINYEYTVPTKCKKKVFKIRNTKWNNPEGHREVPMGLLKMSAT